MRHGPGDILLRTSISRAVGELAGCAPAETYLERDLVVCTHARGGGTDGPAFSERELIATIEDLTGRPVVAFLDAREADAPVRAELFFLEPRQGLSPRPFRLAAHSYQAMPILRVTGDIDRVTVPAVERRARRQIERNGGDLVLDLSATTFMAVAAIHLLERLSRLASASGGELFVVLGCARARRVLELVPPSASVNVVQTAEEAVAIRRRAGFTDTA